MLDKLQAIKDRWEEIGEKLTAPDIMRDMKEYARLSKAYKDVKVVVDVGDEYKNVVGNIESSKDILRNEKDDEFREMAKMELEELEVKREELEAKIKVLLIPQDPEDEKDAILEIRAGTGGDEAGIFAGDLFRMYTKFCETKNWKMELITTNESSAGGYKEIVANIKGQDVYGQLKYESGVHRVQRVPETESQGRVHTSAATVAVLPEADEVDVVVNPADVRVDTYRASGAGGQHVNKTDSAVRMTHIPTGIVAECQDERSQLKNRNQAMKMLRTRLYEKELQEHMKIIATKRKTIVSTGDRSAKIRTYNFSQGRVTDHRIHLTLYNLEGIMYGDIQGIIDALQIAENAEKMKAAGEVQK
jgi:peptide chain release factor 1